MRDHIRETSGEPVSFVQIDVAREEILARNMPRVAAFCKAADKTEEECWAMWGCEKTHGAYHEGCWEKVFLKWDPFKGY